MNNRLPNFSLFSILLVMLILFMSEGKAQFTQVGPDTLYVDASCTSVFNHGVSGATYSNTDSTGWTFQFDPVLTGFTDGDVVNSGTIINVTYTVDFTFTSDTFFYQTIVADTMPPVFVNIPPDVTLDCFDTFPAAPTITATDDCDNSVMVVLDQQNGMTSNGSCTDTDYTTLRIWKATDDSGNMTVDTQIIRVIDSSKPEYIPLLDTIIDCDMSDTLFTGSIRLTDVNDCDPNVTITHTDNTIAGACPQESVIERTWTVSDACGNDSVSVQMITLIDTIAPTFTPFTGNTVISCDLGLDVNQIGLPTNVMDNCDLTPQMNFASTQFAGAPNCYAQENRWYMEDACGNIDSVVVLVTVIDTVAPVITTEAMDVNLACTNLDIAAAFSNFLMTRGGAVASDNCSTNLTWNTFNTGTSNNANLPAASCPSPQLGVYRQRSVDFVVTDNCGNADTTTAVFTITDVTPPALSACPNDTILSADMNCMASFDLLPPVIAEGCGSSISTENFSTTVLIFPQFGFPPETTPVQTNTFSFGVSGPPAMAIDSAVFHILLKNLDMEDPSEYFNLIDENGNIIGQTNNSATQCDSSITVLKFGPDDINAWALDSVITFTLAPNEPAGLPGNFSVNPICPGIGFADVDMQYNISQPLGIAYEYAINNGTRINPGSVTTVNENFDLGVNDVTYYVTDCSGNQDSCSFQITVIDDTPPVLTCPSDVTLTLAAGDCTVDYTLPFPQNTMDNCGVGDTVSLIAPTNPTDALLTFTDQPDLNAYLADDKTFIINSTGANVISMVDVIISLQADDMGSNDFYTIFDENNNNIGTITGTGCMAVNQVVLTFPSATYNGWASDGTVTFTAVSNIPSVSGYTAGDGINPCDPLAVQNNGDNDGTSFMTIEVQYTELTPSYYATGATTIATTQMQAPMYSPVETLNTGLTEIFYLVEDVNGNADTCSYIVTIEDNENPVALCGPSFVTINPSGTVTDTIFPAEIDLGSTDNCTIDTMIVSPNIVTCNSDTVNVTLTVIDEAGNQSTCQTFVGITAEGPQPSYTVDCNNNTMQLFANPPAGSGGVSYTYEWNGPNNFISFDENPFISQTDGSRAGFYTVEITGITNCSAEGVVEVLLTDLPPVTPDFFIVDNQICSNENIVLTASSPSGSGSADYIWYQEDPAGDIVLNTTNSPFFSFPAPSISGTYCYYVVATRNGCFSQASLTKCVEVTKSPAAMLVNDNITVCEGEGFILEAAPPPGSGFTYEFVGPNVSQTSFAFQLSIPNPTVSDAGTYLLTVSKNGCESNTISATVFVDPIPAQPEITSNSPVCVGDTLKIITNIQNAGTYTWTGPDFTTYTTNESNLDLPNAVANNSFDGNWRVRVTSTQGCISPNSGFENVVVNALPIVSAAVQNAPICDNEDIQLAANSISNATYSWSGPGSFSAGIQNPVANPISGFYNVIVTDQNGCQATDDVLVTLQSSPSIIGVAASDNDCPTGPEDITLKALLTNNTLDYDFVWTGTGFMSNDSCAIIPNATSANNGNYQVIVTAPNSCVDTSSVQVSMGEVVNTPTAPAAANGTTLCEGDALTLSSTINAGSSNVTWYWITPTGTIPTSTSSLVIDPVSLANNGDYRVYAQVDNCFSDTSGVLLITVNPTPLTTIQCLNCPVCEGDDIMLTADCNLIGATYEWTSDNGFNSTNCAPTISNATEADHEGTYTVRAKINDCWSAPVSIFVPVNPRPNNPQAIESGPYCVGTGPITLNVTTGSATPGADYKWYTIDINGNQVLVGSTVSTSFIVPNSASYVDGSYNFFVVADLNGCESLPSPEVTVEVSTVPSNQANAGENLFVCEGDVINLNADTPTVGTGLWQQLSSNPPNAIITNPDAANTSITGLQPGNTYGFVWALSNGACLDYSIDTAFVTVNLVELADAGTDINVCSTDPITLNAIQPSFGIGTWSQGTAQSQLGVVINDINDPNTTIAGIEGGNLYSFEWTIPDNGCGGSSAEVLVRVFDDQAMAGDDQEICGLDCTLVQGNNTSVGGGEWSSPNPNISFFLTNSEGTQAEACGLDEGANILIWTLNDAVCGNAAIDTVIVNRTAAPVPEDDLFDVPFAGVEVLDFTGNDALINGYFVDIVNQPQNGSIVEVSNGIYEYTADINFIGLDLITYELCTEDCGCTEATVSISVGSNAPCDVPTIITPNMDGVNDAFIVPCLAASGQFPDNTVSIFNQWGDEVFSAQSYQNDWQGTYNGEDLPAGTYFFIVDFGNGDKPQNGFLIINR